MRLFFGCQIQRYRAGIHPPLFCQGLVSLSSSVIPAGWWQVSLSPIRHTRRFVAGASPPFRHTCVLVAGIPLSHPSYPQVGGGYPSAIGQDGFPMTTVGNDQTKKVPLFEEVKEDHREEESPLSVR